MTQEILDQAADLQKRIKNANTLLNNSRNQRTESLMFPTSKAIICDDIPFIETLRTQIIMFNEDSLRDLQEQFDNL